MTIIYLGAALVTFLGACSGSQKAPSEPPAPAVSSAPSAVESEAMKEGMTCPIARPGVDVTIDDVDGGVALTFTGSEDQVAFLRQWGAKRAAMASGKAMRPMGNGGMMQGQGMNGKGKGMHGKGMHGEGMHGKGMMMMMPPADAMAEDVPGGVKLTFKAKDAQDVAKLREHTSQHVSMMREGKCPMMQGMAARPAGADSSNMGGKKDEDDHEAHHPK